MVILINVIHYRRSCAIPVFTILLFVSGSIAIADGAQRPNVLLIVSDDLTACLGCYGNEVCQTPHLDRLASQGILFERAYCQYPVCGPSRASFMSGLYPRTTRLLKNDKRLGSYRKTNSDLADHPSIGSFLRNQNYYSARVSKIYHMGIPGGIAAGEPGGDDPQSWDFAANLMAPEHLSTGMFEMLSPLRPHLGSSFSRLIVPDQFEATQADHMAATQAIGILENRSHSWQKQPFFLAVGFVRPHVPLVAPQRLFDNYPADEAKLPVVLENDLDDVPEGARQMENERRYGMDQSQKQKALAAYYASVSFMDEQVGRLLAALDRLNLRDDTVVIFTSDHGYNMGEHDCWQKLSLFEESTRVPLIISAPGQKATQGQKSRQIVELVDLYPTVAELTGQLELAPANLQGESLKTLLENPQKDSTSGAAYTISYGGSSASLRTDRWRYNCWYNKKGTAIEGEELYDHHHDPAELTNLAVNAEYADTIADLRRQLQEKEALHLK